MRKNMRQQLSNHILTTGYVTPYCSEYFYSHLQDLQIQLYIMNLQMDL